MVHFWLHTRTTVARAVLGGSAEDIMINDVGRQEKHSGMGGQRWRGDPSPLRGRFDKAYPPLTASGAGARDDL